MSMCGHGYAVNFCILNSVKIRTVAVNFNKFTTVTLKEDYIFGPPPYFSSGNLRGNNQRPMQCYLWWYFTVLNNKKKRKSEFPKTFKTSLSVLSGIYRTSWGIVLHLQVDLFLRRTKFPYMYVAAWNCI